MSKNHSEATLSNALEVEGQSAYTPAPQMPTKRMLESTYHSKGDSYSPNFRS